MSLQIIRQLCVGNKNIFCVHKNLCKISQGYYLFAKDIIIPLCDDEKGKDKFLSFYRVKFINSNCFPCGFSFMTLYS